MIKKINITNFKCFKELSIPVQKLNILTGTNGMGKSSLIQMLLVLRQSNSNNNFTSKNKYLILNQELIDIGNYEDAIFRDFEKEQPYIKFEIEFSKIKAIWQLSNYYEDSEKISIPVKTENVNSKLLKEPLFMEDKFQFLKAERIGPRDTYDIENKNINDFYQDGRFAMYYFLENRTNDIPIKNLAHPEQSVLTLEYQMNSWMGEISPNIKIDSKYHESDKTKIISLFSYKTEEGLNRKPYKAKNVGFGISYIFSVLLSILSAKKGDLIIIENPESHLHPKGQTKLAELISLAAANGVQFFIETHSDHIINGVRISVKYHQENKDWGIDANDVNILYFHRENNEQSSKTALIGIDTNSELYQIIGNSKTTELPYGFFDEMGNSLAKLI